MQPGHRADRQGVGKTLQRLKANVCTGNGKLIRSHRTTAPVQTGITVTQPLVQTGITQPLVKTGITQLLVRPDCGSAAGTTHVPGDPGPPATLPNLLNQPS